MISRKDRETIEVLFGNDPREFIRILVDVSRNLRNTEPKEYKNVWARVVNALDIALRETRLLYEEHQSHFFDNPHGEPDVSLVMALRRAAKGVDATVRWGPSGKVRVKFPSGRVVEARRNEDIEEIINVIETGELR